MIKREKKKDLKTLCLRIHSLSRTDLNRCKSNSIYTKSTKLSRNFIVVASLYFKVNGMKYISSNYTNHSFDMLQCTTFNCTGKYINTHSTRNRRWWWWWWWWEEQSSLSANQHHLVICALSREIVVAHAHQGEINLTKVMLLLSGNVEWGNIMLVSRESKTLERARRVITC